METEFNLGQIAALNSQLAGVLAGLAFTTLLIYITRSHHAGHRTVHTGVASSLFAAFVSLVMCAINYGTVASATPDVAQTHALMLVHTPVFGMAIMLLFLSIAIAAYANEYMQAARMLCKVVIVVIGPAIIVGELGLGVLTLFQEECGNDCAYPDNRHLWDQPSTWGFAAALGVFALGFGFMFLPRRHMRPQHASSSLTYNLPAYVTLVVMVIDFVMHVLISMQSLNYRPTDHMLIVAELICAVIVAVFSLLCVMALHLSPPPEIGR